MKILLVGSGGREHALAWSLAQDERVAQIFVAPGNGGTAHENKCTNIPIKAEDLAELKAFAIKQAIDFTVVGPEVPLSMGIVDEFEAEGLKIFGPSKAAAHMEASKAFAKEIMDASGVPTAAYQRFTDANEAKRYVEAHGAPIVIKADGLAAGKGVTVAHSLDEALVAVDDILVKKVFGETCLVAEDFLKGEEISYLVLTDGKSFVPMVSAQDHKAVFDGDKGPNTGGMGAYSPASLLTPEEYALLTPLVIEPIVKELGRRGIVYRGILYAGLMVERKEGRAEIKVLEYNCRFGDPETQVILPRMEKGLLHLLMAASEGKLSEVEPCWLDKPAVTVVLASGGYPGDYAKGLAISGADEADKLEGVKVFHAGTALKDDALVTAGGRVLNVTAVGDNLKAALDRAYEAADMISFEAVHFRRDIAGKALGRGEA